MVKKLIGRWLELWLGLMRVAGSYLSRRRRLAFTRGAQATSIHLAPTPPHSLSHHHLFR